MHRLQSESLCVFGEVEVTQLFPSPHSSEVKVYILTGVKVYILTGVKVYILTECLGSTFVAQILNLPLGPGDQPQGFAC